MFLLYDGIHYDPLYREDSSRPGVFVQAVFPISEEALITEALSIAIEAKKVRFLATTYLQLALRCLGLCCLLSDRPC